MKVIVLGCGRLGSQLAMDLSRKGHEVTIIDYKNESFARLASDFLGRTVQGEGMDMDVLSEAGVADADAFVACTSGDNRNLTASQIAREVFKVPHVVSRVSDPLRGEIYAELGLNTVSPTVIGADMVYAALLGQGKLVDCT